jgi:hypothetical protein
MTKGMFVATGYSKISLNGSYLLFDFSGLSLSIFVNQTRLILLNLQHFLVL